MTVSENQKKFGGGFHCDFGWSRRGGHAYGLGYIWEGTAGRVNEQAKFECVKPT